jgi:DNA/RNA-binding domain of Phe-tRNA-synthetase-like protein
MLIQEAGMNPFLIVSETWSTRYPGAAAGILWLRNVRNPDRHPALDLAKTSLEEDLRQRFAGQGRAALEALPILQAYEAYYRPYKKTYHVLLQLESVALKGKALPGVAALVEGMFMAELKNGLLTAGHNADTLQLPIRLEAAQGGERYLLLRGQEAALKPGDMYMADGQGIISSVLYGPDRRTQITPETRNALFAVYAPPGIGREAVERHLGEIQSYVEMIAPETEVAGLEVVLAR